MSTTNEKFTFVCSVELRPEVLGWAEKMELVLRQNDDKRPWTELSFDELFDKLHEEVVELERAMLEMEFKPDMNHCIKRLNINKEALDVSNIAMMIGDRITGTVDWPDYRKKPRDPTRRFSR